MKMKKISVIIAAGIAVMAFAGKTPNIEGMEKEHETYIVEAAYSLRQEAREDRSQSHVGILDVVSVFSEEITEKLGEDTEITATDDSYIGQTDPDFSEIPFYFPDPSLFKQGVPFEEDRKYIAITFDDGPHLALTPQLLDGLKERGVLATFFLLGHRIPGYEDIVKRMYDEGHEVGNHTDGHKLLTSLNKEAIHKEIDGTNEKIEAITGEKVKLIRPPYGARDNKVMDIVKSKDMSVVLWNVDPEDWRHPTAEAIANHIAGVTGEGDIILLHDIYANSVDGALLAIDELLAAGYQFVTVSQLVGELTPGAVYHNGTGELTWK